MADRKPLSRIWTVGRDADGRLTVLRHSCEPNGKETWEIISAPVNQRDEGERIHSLSIENLQAIAEIVAQEKPR